MTPDPEMRELTLKIRHKSEIADGVFLFELTAPDGSALPPFTPGSHITVTAPSGQKRRYSLCNDPAERNRYLIAVKQEAGGRDGSLRFRRYGHRRAAGKRIRDGGDRAEAADLHCRRHRHHADPRHDPALPAARQIEF